MDGYLTKPLEPGKLRDLIAELSTHSSAPNATSRVSIVSIEGPN
jgi:hypothetical protein